MRRNKVIVCVICGKAEERARQGRTLYCLSCARGMVKKQNARWCREKRKQAVTTV
jgi:hypothetical protein